MKRAKIDLVDVNVLGFEIFTHPVSEFEKVFFCLVTAPDSGLIGDDKDQIAELLCGTTKLKDLINKLKILRLADISMINIDYAVTVKKQGGGSIANSSQFGLSEFNQN
jgi:hypothetical protein